MTEEEIKKGEEAAPEASSPEMPSPEAPLETPPEEALPPETQSQPESPSSPPTEPSPPLQPAAFAVEAESQTEPQPQAPADSSFLRQLLAKAKEKIQSRKRAKLEKILHFAADKGKITNDDVQKLLRVSDATATRYLSQLSKEGKLRRVGKEKRPFYESTAVFN